MSHATTEQFRAPILAISAPSATGKTAGLNEMHDTSAVVPLMFTTNRVDRGGDDSKRTVGTEQFDRLSREGKLTWRWYDPDAISRVRYQSGIDGPPRYGVHVDELETAIYKSWSSHRPIIAEINPLNTEFIHYMRDRAELVGDAQVTRWVGFYSRDPMYSYVQSLARKLHIPGSSYTEPNSFVQRCIEHTPSSPDAPILSWQNDEVHTHASTIFRRQHNLDRQLADPQRRGSLLHRLGKEFSRGDSQVMIHQLAERNGMDYLAHSYLHSVYIDRLKALKQAGIDIQLHEISWENRKGLRNMLWREVSESLAAQGNIFQDVRGDFSWNQHILNIERRQIYQYDGPRTHVRLRANSLDRQPIPNTPVTKTRAGSTYRRHR